MSDKNNSTQGKAQLVLAFGERQILESIKPYEYLRKLYPTAEIIINSTSGEIYPDGVQDHTVIVTAIQFDKTTIKSTRISINDYTESFKAGEQIAEALDQEDLNAIFIISDGGKVNGSSLIAALNARFDKNVPITGGLAGDGTAFEKTVVGLNAEPESGQIAAIGFYGNSLHVGHGSVGGWDVYGPEREITKSAYNVLYKIGDKQALDLYKEYLGNYASSLPGGALYFPLSIKATPDSEPLVRTILSIDEHEKTMTFAGEMPEGALVRFMKANFDRLIDASSTAAQNTFRSFSQPPELAILISCVGRKLVLGQRTEEEIEVAKEIFGDSTYLTGFYSYGEISPLFTGTRCELHNQTMTITTFTED